MSQANTGYAATGWQHTSEVRSALQRLSLELKCGRRDEVGHLYLKQPDTSHWA
jgi:hypothetical protein